MYKMHNTQLWQEGEQSIFVLLVSLVLVIVQVLVLVQILRVNIVCHLQIFTLDVS